MRTIRIRKAIATDPGAIAEVHIAYAAIDPRWLEHLYVSPEARGAGMGSALLAKA